MTTHTAQPQFRAELPFTPAAPTTARSQLRLFAHNLTTASIDDAVVMVSELVTNAVQHGRPEITLRVWLSPDRLTVAVTDHGQAPLPLTSPAPQANQPRGRGLLIVDALAARWGVSHTDGAIGKTVWFDLATS